MVFNNFGRFWMVAAGSLCFWMFMYGLDGFGSF